MTTAGLPESSRYWYWRKRWWLVGVWTRSDDGTPFVGYVSWARRTLRDALAALELHRQASDGNGAEYALVFARRKSLP